MHVCLVCADVRITRTMDTGALVDVILGKVRSLSPLFCCVLFLFLRFLCSLVQLAYLKDGKTVPPTEAELAENQVCRLIYLRFFSRSQRERERMLALLLSLLPLVTF